MLVLRVLLEARIAEVHRGARATVPAQGAGGDGLHTRRTEDAKGRRGRIEEVVQHHGRRVLGTTEGVELVVAELAHLQEGVPRVHKAVRDRIVLKIHTQKGEGMSA